MLMRNRILVADDNETVRKVIAALLQSNGFTVCAEAIDGEDAVTKAMEPKPDLIVIDLVMPSLNGLGASAKISELLPGVPIVLYTLHATSNLELEAKKNGISRVVPKSEGHSIVSHIRQLLDSDGSSLKSPLPSASENPPLAPLETGIVEPSEMVDIPDSQPNSALRKAS
jgi:DNA-binding NarL/FixJ family response regulator